MDTHQIQFILKSMLGLSCLVLFFLPSSLSSPIQTPNVQQYSDNNKGSSSTSFQPIVGTPVQQQNQPKYQTQRQGFETGSYQQQQPNQEEIYKTYNPNFVTNYQQLTKSGAEIVNIRPTRRTILSTLMAPFMSMRESAMNMLAQSLQGCNSSQVSMWCRFWGMFFKK